MIFPDDARSPRPVGTLAVGLVASPENVVSGSQPSPSARDRAAPASCRLSTRAIAKACGTSAATISLILKHGKYPKNGAEALRQKLVALGVMDEGRRQDAGAALSCAEGAGLQAGFTPARQTSPTASAGTGRAGRASSEKEKPMLRKQSLLPKARQTFSIHGDPFGAEVRSADDVYMNDNIRYVREAVYMTAKHGGMMAVIGESGSGKSTVRRDLRDRLKREALPIIPIEPYVIAMDDDALGKPLRADHIAEAILHAIAPTLRAPRSPERRFRLLHKALQESARAGNRHVLIIEEAHDLHGKTLKHLKRFYELEDGFDRLLSIILFGQSELKAKLGESNADVREVVQRMELVELRPMTDPEGYIRHRRERAGMKFEKLFSPDAMDALRLKHSGPGAYEKGKAREAVSLLYPLAVGNTLIAACNLAAEIGMDKITGDIINRV